MNQTKSAILVVSNQPNDRSVITEILEEQYELVYAANRREAMHILRSSSTEVSVILLDLQTSEKDSWDVLSEVLNDKHLKHIPLIVTTALMSPADEERIFEWGVSDFVPKPINPTLLQNRVKNAIRMYEASSTVREYERDELTGLYTRAAFLRRGEQLMKANPAKKYGILALDLDNFKMANTLYGEEKCDEYLAFLGKTIRENKTNSIAGRFGGDQFAIMFEVHSDDEVFPLWHFQDSILNDAPIPMQTIKKGIYAPMDPELSMIRCCDRAFIAIRDIKGVYDKNVAFYDEQLTMRLMDEQRIMQCMHEALEEGQFKVYYQPKHDSMSGRIAGAEALVRWIHPEYGFMPPNRFVSLFERNGFITKVDAFVMEQVCKDLKRWIEEGKPVVPISVNMSRRDYLEEGWVDNCLKTIDRYGINHSLIHMEVTESLYAERMDLITNQVKKLQGHGYLVEMDDFGAGYSSLGLLSSFPIDVIKLDISFVRQLETNEIVIENIIKLAHRMGFKTVAEGAETEKQVRVLRSLGCDFIQGYFFSKPLPVEEFEQYLTDKNCAIEGVEEDKVITDSWSSITSELEIKSALLSCIDTLKSNEDNTVRINRLLATIGKFYGAARSFIFEVTSNGTQLRNTFEWCHDGATPLIGKLQNVPCGNIPEWVESIRERGERSIEKVEDLKDNFPTLYRAFRIANVSRMMVVPLMSNGEIVGFFGVENQSVHTDTQELMHSLSSFIINELDRIRYIEKLENVSYRDSLTGFKNRRAYYEEVEAIENSPERRGKPLGIVYADVNGLKAVNDAGGHDAGDALISGVAKILRIVFADADIFRMGGDEFVVFDYSDDEEEFNACVKELPDYWSDERSASIGSVWIKEACDLEQAIAQADQVMYNEKTSYYERRFRDRRKNRPSGGEIMINVANDVAESLPGAYFTYHADEEAKLIFFNKELMHIFECENANELRDLTGNVFTGMLADTLTEEERERLFALPTAEGTVLSNAFDVRTKSGAVKRVYSWRKYTSTEKYGQIFNVFMTEEFMLS